MVFMANVRLGNRDCSTCSQYFRDWKRLGRKKDQRTDGRGKKKHQNTLIFNKHLKINTMNYIQAQQRVHDLKKFYKNLLWFGIVAIFIFADDILEKGIFNLSLWDGSIILAIWGIILILKAVKLFIFDSEWERGIIEKEMKKTKEPIQL